MEKLLLLYCFNITISFDYYFFKVKDVFVQSFENLESFCETDEKCSEGKSVEKHLHVFFEIQ